MPSPIPTVSALILCIARVCQRQLILLLHLLQPQSYVSKILLINHPSFVIQMTDLATVAAVGVRKMVDITRQITSEKVKDRCSNSERTKMGT